METLECKIKELTQQIELCSKDIEKWNESNGTFFDDCDKLDKIIEENKK